MSETNLYIRNFVQIGHIDHGKSTLADRLLQMTDTVLERDMMEQVLDSMDLERERGVTIKASAVRMKYTAKDGKVYQFNLIDAPGHSDFQFEMSRALAACEGAILVVDSTQGIQAQTLAHLYVAIDQDLEIIPVVNKVDLPSARPDEVAQEIEDLTGIDALYVLPVSGKTGYGVDNLLEKIVSRIPAPKGDLNAPLRCLVFDSHYDPYKGVIAYVRVIDGQVSMNDELTMMATEAEFEPLEVGIFSLPLFPTGTLQAGEVGYVATGLKTIREVRVGDTMFRTAHKITALEGYAAVKPMVFAGFYPTEGEDYGLLKDALEKLQLNDAALVYQPENSQALGFGFRCGFLGLFHMSIIQERLEREYDLDILATAPSVQYHITRTNGEEMIISSPAELPEPSLVKHIAEPWMRIDVYTPADYIGPVMEITTKRRGETMDMEYLDGTRVRLAYKMPLSEMIIDYYDLLKSVTRGYASLDYYFDEYRVEDLVKVDVLVNKQIIDALSIITHREDSFHRGQKLVSKLKDLIPRQQFVVPVQAAIGNKVISRANVKAYRKDVTGYLYGGDVTRKKKLLEKQKKGKRRMKMVGQVEISQDAFMAVLSLGDDN